MELGLVITQEIGAMHNGTPFLPQTDVQQQMDDFVRAAAQRVYTQPCL
jgi:hypothetical protein